MIKVSDFKLAEHFLKSFARSKKTSFVDCEVDFVLDKLDNGPTTDFVGKKIIIHSPDKISHTLISVIGTYIVHWKDITGSNIVLSESEQNNLLKLAASMIRAFVYSGKIHSEKNNHLSLTVTLSQFPFVWMFIRDIISPINNLQLNDVKVVETTSPYVDCAKFVPQDKEEPKNYLPAILVNTSIPNGPVRLAFLLVEALKAMDANEKNIVSDILSCPDTKKTIYGFVKMALVEEQDVDDFFLTLAVVGGYNNPISQIDKSESTIWFKIAQQRTPSIIQAPQSSWMNPTLIEGTMEAARGPDYSVKQILEPYVIELWKKVEEEKKRLGKEDMSFENLLRVQSKGMRPTPKQTLQALLSEQRIW